MDPGDPAAHWNRGGAAVRRAVGGQRHPGNPRHRRGGIRQPARQAIGEKGITEKGACRLFAGGPLFCVKNTGRGIPVRLFL